MGCFLSFFGCFWFCSVKILSSQRVQRWASQTFCALCLPSQLITSFYSERYSLSLCLKTVNTTIQSVHCKSAFPVSRGASALPYIYLLVCKCPLHILKRHCDVIKHTQKKTVSAVDCAPKHCSCPFGVSAAAMMKTNTFVSTADIKLHQFHHPNARHHTL